MNKATQQIITTVVNAVATVLVEKSIEVAKDAATEIKKMLN